MAKSADPPNQDSKKDGKHADSKSSERVAQAGVIPVRRMPDGQLEFCLVTSRSTKEWIFPKGKVDPGENAPAAAVRETREEAGLVGHVVGKALGSYVYPKSGKPHEVMVYLMEIDQVLPTWDEFEHRFRVFTSAAMASRMVPFPELRDLIRLAQEAMTGR